MSDERLAALEQRVGLLEDIQAIRRLHWAYGYYIDFNRPEEVAELFAEDGAVVFLSGEYVGHAGVKRLYGDWIAGRFTGGKPGPVNGLLLDHFQMQDVITVAPDRQTAKGRFHGILLGGWHDDFQETREEMMPQQFMEAGIYENDYVKVANEFGEGTWRIKRLDYMMQWQGDYENGWAHTTAHLQPATKTWPEDPLGPDRLLPADQHRKTWPYRQDVPMHFAHPKFGALLAGQEPR
ncbi:MAG: nuclear transport factor 2 family protein [Croceibacterium sp.]